jgi:phosphatidylserine/phosphatidylglycerophosphate/cardiolipin synthase-like enzyme
VIIDPFSIKARSPVKKMREANLPIFVWNPPVVVTETKSGKKIKKRRPLMHDKFCILGDYRVWTGSFNFTFEATSANRENVIVLENREIASLYIRELERLKKEGCSTFNSYIAQQK